MNKRWQILEGNKLQITQLQQSLNVSEALCHILISRGITNYDKAKSYFRPTLDDLHDPFLMKDMQKAVDRIELAIAKKEKILVYGDYDVDGATSAALLIRLLGALGLEAGYYIPDRLLEGYGPSGDALVSLRDSGASLVVTVDCGAQAFEALSMAHEAGLDVIVVDHHKCAT